MNAIFRMLNLFFAGIIIYVSYKLYMKGHFVHKGTALSIEDTPIMFFLLVGGFFGVGLYLVYAAIFVDFEGE